MATLYTLTTEHPTLEKYSGVNVVTVYKNIGQGSYFADGIWGCSRDYPTPEQAIRSLLDASSTRLIRLEQGGLGQS